MRRVVLSALCALIAIALLAAAGRDQAGGGPTFNTDVAPIIYSRCVSCHRPGQAAPMALLSYRDVRPWAQAIKRKVAAREMPPWYADARFGTFRNNPSLTQQEIDTIVDWVNAGARQGEDA